MSDIRLTPEAGRVLREAFDPDEGYSAPKVCEIVGVTYRQLDYWVRTEIITPSITTGHGSGTRRRFSEDDLRLVRFVKSMLDAGVHLQVIRAVVADFQSSPPPPGTFLVFQGLFDTHTRGGGGEYRGGVIARTLDDLPAMLRNGPCWVYEM